MDKEKLLKQLLDEVAKDLSLAVNFKIEKPADDKFGDLSTNLAMTSFVNVRENYSSPRAWAQTLAEKIKSKDGQSIIEEISIAGPGFINFKLSSDHLLDNLAKVIKEQKNDLIDLGQGKKAIVEYSSPNIAKPFTVGHLRSTIIGDSIANLLEASGYQVFRDNHLGDWGTQFGKQIIAIQRFGDEDKIAKAVNPVKELVALYIRFHEEAEKDPALDDTARLWFKKLEDGDKEARRLWQKCIDWSFIEFARIYDYLGVKFTENNGRGYGESFFEKDLQALIKELQDQGVAKLGKEDAILIFYPNDELSPLMIAKKDGSTLYATRDLATDKWRRHNPRYQNTDGSAPLVVNEVGSEQAFYFRQLYRIEEILGWYAKGQRVHVGHGLYRFKEGKMSTRKGNVIWLEEVLAKAKEKALAFTKDEAIAEAVSVAALKWNDLRRKSELNINFDWEEILNLQGNSGPYMLYTYARAKSVLRKAAEQKVANGKDEDKTNNPYKISSLEKNLIEAIAQLPKVVARASSEFSPHFVCNYLFDLAQTFNSFYNKYQILSSPPEEKVFRLRLVEATAITIKQGLALLGIRTLEKM